MNYQRHRLFKMEDEPHVLAPEWAGNVWETVIKQGRWASAQPPGP